MEIKPCISCDTLNKFEDVTVQNWYCYAKTVAEQGAWEVARKRGLDLVVGNPVLVLGPLLQPTVNASTDHVMKYLTGSAKTYVNAAQAYVHVRDVAEAHVRVYEAAHAHGRYICAESTLHRGELCRILAKLFPEYPIPTKYVDKAKAWLLKEKQSSYYNNNNYYYYYWRGCYHYLHK